MASIQVGRDGGKRALDADIPLVPFIDLLLCWVMLLLVTAVWNELSQLHASQETPGPRTDAAPATPPGNLVVLSVGQAGYVLAVAADDGVPYRDVLAAMDVAIGHGFSDVDVGAGGSL